jgi:MFS family permease
MAFVVVGIAQLLAVLGLAWLRTTPIRRELDDAHRHPIAAMFTDIKDGFVYMVHTPWLLATLLYATLLILVIMGPIEVLLPFVVTDTTGGGAAAFALVLAAFGLGGAIASLIVASLRLPRRYLTVMNLCWGVGSVPLIVVGFTGQLWAFALALFLVGFGYSAGTVIWGTLLQRRVPPAMLGRVSSLDFFVSLAFMPISMAVAGPVGEAIGYGWTFLIAGAVPVVLAVGAILIARMPRDELEHPLDIDPTAADTGDERAGVAESSGEPERA